MKVRQKVLLLGSMLVWLLAAAAPIAQGDIVFLDDFAEDSEKGRFVIEAEHYSSRSSLADAGWWEVDGSDHKFTEGPSDGQEAPTVVKAGKGAGGSQKLHGDYGHPVLLHCPHRQLIRWRIY